MKSEKALVVLFEYGCCSSYHLSLSLSLSFVCVLSSGGLRNNAALYFKCRQRETYGTSEQLSGSLECGVDECCMVCAKVSEAYLNLNDRHMNSYTYQAHAWVGKHSTNKTSNHGLWAPRSATNIPLHCLDSKPVETSLLT